MQRAFGLEIPETLEEACDPSRAALVVYDMQVGVLDQIANATRSTCGAPLRHLSRACCCADC
jgi:biuret amidohydrolase